MRANHKIVIIIFSICTLLALVMLVMLVFVKFPYFSWHCYFKHEILKITSKEQLNKKIPIKKMKSEMTPPVGWQRIDLLELSINLPKNPEKVYLNQGKALYFEYPDFAVAIWGIMNYRKQQKIPMLKKGRLIKIFPHQHNVMLNRLTSNDIKFSNSSYTNRQNILQLMMKAISIGILTRHFFFETPFSKGRCATLKNDSKIKKTRHLNIYAPKDDKGCNIGVATTNENVTEKELFQIIDTIIKGIKFSPGFPTEDKIIKQFRLFATEKEETE